MKFLLCPIGPQVILGTPWFETVKVLISLKKKQFLFRPSESVSSKKWFSFPLTPSHELAAWKRKYLQKQPKIGRPAEELAQPLIARVSLKELERYWKSSTVFHVDLKEVDELESITEGKDQGKLNPEATARDPGVLSIRRYF